MERRDLKPKWKQSLRGWKGGDETLFLSKRVGGKKREEGEKVK